MDVSLHGTQPTRKTKRVNTVGCGVQSTGGFTDESGFLTVTIPPGPIGVLFAQTEVVDVKKESKLYGVVHRPRLCFQSKKTYHRKNSAKKNEHRGRAGTPEMIRPLCKVKAGHVLKKINSGAVTGKTLMSQLKHHDDGVKPRHLVFLDPLGRSARPPSSAQIPSRRHSVPPGESGTCCVQ